MKKVYGRDNFELYEVAKYGDNPIFINILDDLEKSCVMQHGDIYHESRVGLDIEYKMHKGIYTPMSVIIDTRKGYSPRNEKTGEIEIPIYYKNDNLDTYMLVLED